MKIMTFLASASLLLMVHAQYFTPSGKTSYDVDRERQEILNNQNAILRQNAQLLQQMSEMREEQRREQQRKKVEELQKKRAAEELMRRDAEQNALDSDDGQCARMTMFFGTMERCKLRAIDNGYCAKHAREAKEKARRGR